MHRIRASHVVITAISGAILGGIACDRPSGSSAITTRSDTGKPAQDAGEDDSEAGEVALVRAVEYATGVNHDSPDVDWGAIADINAMWSIASVTTAEAGNRAFITSQNKAAAPVELDNERPSYTDCEAKTAEPGALNDLLPVLFQHEPGDPAKSHWEPLRKMVSQSDLVWVTCKEAPKMVVGVNAGKVVAARESLDAALELQPADEREAPEPEPGGPPPATIQVSSPVDGVTIEFEGAEAELPHKLTGVSTSNTLRFKVKAPGHLDAEVGALPMDVLTMLQGGEPQTNFNWVVWPNPAR